MEEPTKLDSTTIATVSAIVGSAVTAFFAWVTVKGGGWATVERAIDKWFGARKQLRDEAKEGPLMVLQRVEAQLKHCEEMLSTALSEVSAVRDKYFNCETEKAALRTENKFLREQLAAATPSAN